MIGAEVCFAVLVLEALVLRKRLVRLTNLRIRRIWLVWLALIDQIVVISFLPDHPHILLSIANFVSYLVAGLFIWSNRRIPGALVIGLGGACNVLAIALNGGRMPASETALRASGWTPPAGHFVNSGLVADPKLAFLGDIFNTPRWLPGHTVFSVGDVIVMIGFALLVYLTCAKAPEERARPRNWITALAKGFVGLPGRRPDGLWTGGTGGRALGPSRAEGPLPQGAVQDVA